MGVVGLAEKPVARVEDVLELLDEVLASFECFGGGALGLRRALAGGPLGREGRECTA